MLTLDVKETCRYLGYGASLPDETVLQAIDETAGLLTPLLTPKETHRMFPLELNEDAHTAYICGLAVQSRALINNLRGCTHVVMMAATIGFGPELLSRKSSVTGKLSRALIADAAGSALIESWCDEVNASIRAEASSLGLFARPRFSPGYGDFPLEFQRDIFRVLEVQKRIGITLSEQLLMLPAKSVTALIGLSPTDSRCPVSGCESCGRADTCAYRRVNQGTVL